MNQLKTGKSRRLDNIQAEMIKVYIDLMTEREENSESD